MKVVISILFSFLILISIFSYYEGVDDGIEDILSNGTHEIYLEDKKECEMLYKTECELGVIDIDNTTYFFFVPEEDVAKTVAAFRAKVLKKGK